VTTLVLLILVGDALRDALDPRKEVAAEDTVEEAA
jgi:ABC-type dipeptide/oligopeptide/nickel transport system permease subunit